MRGTWKPLSDLEKKIGYSFQNAEILQKAFTHSTYSEAYGGENTERMEYLGDAVLELVVSKKQYLSHRRQSEGEMTKERQTLVCQEALLKQAETLGLANYLRFVGGAANVGDKTVASLYETLVAAIYLDGGFEAAEAFVLRYYPTAESDGNYIGKLQEFLQRKGEPLPVYSEAKKSGEDHRPTFTVVATAGGVSADGVGGSVAKARQQAAKKLYGKLKR